MEILPDCSNCGLEEESTEHVLLRCRRAKLIWRMAGSQPWGASTGPWLPSFLEAIQRSAGDGPSEACQLVYIAYQIWLSLNNLIFYAEDVLAKRILERAYYLAIEYHHFDSASLILADPSFWDSLTPPPSEFAKVNFNGSVKDGRDGSGFVIRDPDSWILAARGSPLYEASVPSAKLHAAWAGIIYAIRKLRA
uniref:Uncharacterized protein LOC105047223 n=1 Tax=Elaeis guineensis var. tenera TaxID=51953 RepID=A0A6I9RCF6_ELAGV|nr:uncharacterized protein LOC105047223 [Elaeis guineensis]